MNRRGFTLIELMIVVAIISLLASVAIPTYKTATLRARAAERGTILRATGIGVEDALVRWGSVAAAYQQHPDLVPDSRIVGADNPPGAPTIGKRSFQNGMTWWRDINVLQQGDCYYTYHFDIDERTGEVATYSTSARGNLDGDTNESTKVFHFTRADGRWNQDGEDPPAGLEDLLTF